MASHLPAWLVLATAFLGANLPFVSERLFGLVALPAGRKPAAVRLCELVALYFCVGALGLLLEKRAGQIAPQGWEFYAVTAALFLTLGFPGFTWRFLVRRKE